MSIQQKWGLATFIVYCLVLMWLIFVHPLNLTPPPVGATVLDRVERLSSTAMHPVDLPTTGWESVSLPDRWRDKPVTNSSVWYRMRVSPDVANNDRLSLYVPSVRQNLAVYVDGKLAGLNGAITDSVSRRWIYPAMFEITGLLSNKMRYQVHVQVRDSIESRGHISQIYLGTPEQIEPAWRWRHDLNVGLLKASSILLAIVGLVNLGIFFFRPQDTYYGWYALAAFAWCYRGYLLGSPDTTMSDALWVALRLWSLGLGVVAVCLFNFRFFNYRNKIVEWLLILYIVPAGLPMLFMNFDWLQFYGHQGWARVQIPIALGVMVFLIHIFIKKGDNKALLLLASGVPLFLLGLRDLLVLNGHFEPYNGFLINYATPPALMVAMYFLLRRFATSLNAAEELNVQLESKVASKEAELDAFYQQREETKAAERVQEERERMMRDMHDGIGGYLVALRAYTDNEQIQPDRIKDYADKSLADLRFIIRSLDVQYQNVGMILGSLRPQWQKQADDVGMRLHWDVGIEESQYSPTFTDALHIMRMVQEAFTNCLKHSNASDIRVSTEHTRRANGKAIYVIRVSDNGTTPWPSDTGTGLSNLTRRAHEIGAELTVNKEPSHREIRIELPIDDTQPPGV